MTMPFNMTYDRVQDFQISSFNYKINCLNRKTTVFLKRVFLSSWIYFSFIQLTCISTYYLFSHQPFFLSKIFPEFRLLGLLQTSVMSLCVYTIRRDLLPFFLLRRVKMCRNGSNWVASQSCHASIISPNSAHTA